VRAWLNRRRAFGRKEEALREGRRAIELLPVEKDAVNGALINEYLAMIAAWVGDRDLADEQLGAAIRYPSSLSYGRLKLLPFWDLCVATHVLSRSSPPSRRNSCSRLPTKRSKLMVPLTSKLRTKNAQRRGDRIRSRVKNYSA
jgi:hypothetical protein